MKILAVCAAIIVAQCWLNAAVEHFLDEIDRHQNFWATVYVVCYLAAVYGIAVAIIGK